MVSYKLPSSLTNVSSHHDVFLSFRGEDTRAGFTSYLYDALTSKHIRTYIDDKSLQSGSFIATELPAAIEASTFAIVVLSSDFATSKWCLEEITKIVDCEKQGILTIIPIFYYVDPSNVRHQRNSIEDAFIKHENDPTIVPQKVKRWRDAFARVGGISGVHITPHR